MIDSFKAYLAKTIRIHHVNLRLVFKMFRLKWKLVEDTEAQKGHSYKLNNRYAGVI